MWVSVYKKAGIMESDRERRPRNFLEIRDGQRRTIDK